MKNKKGQVYVIFFKKKIRKGGTPLENQLEKKYSTTYMSSPVLSTALALFSNGPFPVGGLAWGVQESPKTSVGKLG